MNESAPPLLIVAMPSGPNLAMEHAFLAGAARASGLAPRWVAADFGIDDAAFQATLAASGAVGVLLPYTTEMGASIDSLARLVRAAVDVPVVIVGDGVGRERGALPSIEGVALHAADPGQGLLAVARGEAPPPPSHASVPLDLTYLGPGLPQRPLAASLFGDMGTVALAGSRAARGDLSPVAAFARWQAPVGDEAVVLDSSVALEPLAAVLDGVECVEWWDADGPSSCLDPARVLRHRGVRQSMRVRIDRNGVGVFGVLKEAGVGRVLFDVDRVADAEPLPGSNASIEEVAPWLDAARAAGLEVGLVVAVGLPGETRAAGRARAERITQLHPDRLRCAPFEPTGGTPAWDVVMKDGLLPVTDVAIREVHRPLVQDSLTSDEYWANWTDALCSLAAIEGERTQ